MIIKILNNEELIKELANNVVIAYAKKQSKRAILDGEEPEYKLDRNGTAKKIAEHFHIKAIENNLFFKDINYYEFLQEQEIRKLISRFLTAYNNDIYKFCSKSSVSEILEMIKSYAYQKSYTDLNNYTKLIPFQDGTLNLDTMQEYEGNKDNFVTYQIPCNYFTSTGSKSTKLFDEFISTLAGYDPEEDETKKKKRLEVERLLKCFVGYTLSGKEGYREKSCLWLYGEGNTGKSKYFKLIEKLVGSENTLVIDFADLQERFRTAQLLGKRFAGSPECSDKVADGVNKFKSISAGDSVTVEHKGQNPFQMVYTGTLLFCSNNMPRIIGDTGNHVYKRIVPIECTNIIPKDKQNPRLIEDMMKDSELIAKECLDIFKECGERLPELSDAEERRIEFKKYNSSVLSFAYDYLIFDDIGNAKSRYSNVYEKYSKYCELYNQKPFCRAQFSQTITSEFGKGVIFKGNGNEVYFKARIKEGLLKELEG